MPTYVYRCNNHKKPLDKHFVFSIHDDKPEQLCIDCGKPMVRVFSAPPVTWMGSGWAGKDR